jgi:hypothetical protein
MNHPTNPPPDFLTQFADLIVDHLRRIQESLDSLELLARDIRRETSLGRRERKAR